MTTIDWIKRFKSKLTILIDDRAVWDREELEERIEEAYMSTLEEMINLSKDDDKKTD